MAAPKRPGGNAGKGRKAGVPNKLTKDLKAMVLGALEANGGQKWLEAQMEKNPTAFMTLLGKVLPTTLAGSVEVKRDVRELTDAELDAIMRSGRDASPPPSEDEPHSVH
jgi:hypothetical protein